MLARDAGAWPDEAGAGPNLKPGRVVMEAAGGGQGVAAALGRRGMTLVAPARSPAEPEDLVVANHSLAHAVDLDRAVAALVAPLGAEGAVAVEVHHAARLLTETQIDLICHPHRTYLSVAALIRAS